VAGKNERQRRIAREKHRRQQELRMARRRQQRKRGVIVLSVILGAALIASLLAVFLPGGSTKHPSASASKSPSATPSATTVAEPAHHCTYTKTGTAARAVSLPSAAPDYTASYQATINTNLGKIAVNLENSKATCTVNSFVHLAEAGYFNNTQCHRLLTSGIYVLQCGDPYATASTKLTCSSTGKIGTGTPGYEFASENLTGRQIPGRHGRDGQRRQRDH
jgi:peptidyl-prolyl cis-trans isomerase B (cyclophilin B)